MRDKSEMTCLPERMPVRCTQSGSRSELIWSGIGNNSGSHFQPSAFCLLPSCLIKFLLFAILILRAGLPLSSQAENTHSMPFGFVRIEIPTNDARALVSIPFYSLDPAIQTMFSGQLISTNVESAHRIVKWDAEKQAFIYAVKLSGTNDAVAGQWDIGGSISRETASPSDMTLYPGEGFFIESDESQAIFLWGQLVLDPSIALHLKPGLNLISFPYSSAKPISDTGLPISGTDADVITKYGELEYWQAVNVSTNAQQPAVFRWQSSSGEPGGSAVFEIGSGYWYQRNATNELIWTEERPYADLFPTSGPPFVIAMRPNNAGDEMTLTIACSGAPGELLDISYKDAGPTNELSVLGGWLPAARGLPTPTTTNQEYSIITWTDSGSATRPRVNDVFVRHYLLVRADLDRDGDGASDAEELFVRGTNPQVSDSFVESQLSGTSSNEITSVAQSASYQENIIYIDQKTGDDSYSGHSASVVGTDGPKKTIAGGLAITQPGDTVIVREGIYGESMNLLGKGVTVIIQGKVDLTRRGRL